MDNRRLRTLSVLLLAGASLAGCWDDDDPIAVDPIDPVELTFSFDDDLQGWEPVAIDTLNPPIEWRVEHTDQEGYEGDGAVELFLNNINDAGKVWIEGAVELVPGINYDVDISYKLGTSDWGDVNLFTIITGVNEVPPRDAEDLFFQGDTGHDQGQDAGLVWLDKAYQFDISPLTSGLVYVSIGVWGTFESPRTYYIDEVLIRFTPSDV
jgi:hypothetical protein